jgi:hypothetical protein
MISAMGAMHFNACISLAKRILPTPESTARVRLVFDELLLLISHAGDRRPKRPWRNATPHSLCCPLSPPCDLTVILILKLTSSRVENQEASCNAKRSQAVFV